MRLNNLRTWLMGTAAVLTFLSLMKRLMRQLRRQARLRVRRHVLLVRV